MLHIPSFLRISLLKTFYFNFKYFDFATAIKFPFFISRSTKLLKTNGKVVIECSPYTGMFTIGMTCIGTIDNRYERCIWEVDGILKIKGKTRIGAGSRISIDEGGYLEFGDNFSISGRSTINVNKSIVFGQDCMLSWDIMLMDTDYHTIRDHNLKVINPARPITLGNHVWVGCRTIILKGVSIPDNNIIAANSTITRSVNVTSSIIGGSGSNVIVLKENISWER